jgi:hypothetical protein
MKVISIAMFLLLVFTFAYTLRNVAGDPAKQLLVETDKTTYCPGETVAIYIRNTGDEAVDLTCDPAFTVYDQLHNPVYPNIVLWIIITINPGETKSFTWNQINAYTGNPVPQGVYSVESYSELLIEPSASFTITSCPVGGSSTQIEIQPLEHHTRSYICLTSVLVATAVVTSLYRKPKHRTEK